MKKDPCDSKAKKELNPMELIETYENLLSEKEDLMEQLDKQAAVMQQLQAKLKLFKSQNQDYMVLLSQLEHQGKFPEHNKVFSCQIAISANQEEITDSKIEVEQQNKVLRAEIKCMQSQLDDMTKDYKALSVRSRQNSTSKEEDQKFELSDFVHNLSLEFVEEEVSEEDKELQKMSSLLKDMTKDVKSATKARDLVKIEAKMWKDEADSINKTMCEILTKPTESKEKANLVDLDSILVENCNLHKKYEKGCQSSKVPKRPRFLCHKYSLGGRSRPRGFVTSPQVQKTLHMLSKQPNLIPKCNRYLQNATVMLLEALKNKDEQVKLQKKIYSSANKKLEHFLYHYGDIHEQEDFPKPLKDSEEPQVKREVEGPEIDFEQPPNAVTSITNHNFSYSGYELLPSKSDERIGKDLASC